MKTRLLKLWPWALWLALAFTLLGVAPLAHARRIVGQGIDLHGTVWMHVHFRRAIFGEAEFFHSDAQFWPEGKDLLADTGGNILDGLLSLPFQLLWGAPDFIDPYTICIFVLNAWAFSVLARRLGATDTAAALLGCVYMFDPYIMREIEQGRTTQATMFFLPLAVAAMVRLEDGGIKRGVAFGAFVLAHGYVYWYNLYFFVLGLTPLALFLIAHRPKRVLPALGVAVALVVVGTLPFLVEVLERIEADAMPRLSWDGGHRESPLGRPGTAHQLAARYESVLWPVVFVVGLFAGRRWLPFGLGMLGALSLALGTRVSINRVMHDNPLAIWMYDHVPLMPRLAFPDRLSGMLTLLMLAAVAAGPAGRRTWLAVGLAVLALGEATWRHRIPIPYTTFERPVATEVVAKGGGAVIELPYGLVEDQLVHQVWHGQPLFGGMAERDPDFRPAATEERLRNAFMVMLASTFGAQDFIGYRKEDRDEITQHFRWVWLDRRFGGRQFTKRLYDPEGKILRLTEELGPPVAQDKFVVLWDLTLVPAEPPGFTMPLPTASQRVRMEEAVRMKLWGSGLKPVRAKER